MIAGAWARLRQSSLVRATGVYTAAGVVNGSIVFLLMPILTRYLSQEEYGLVAIFRVIVAFVAPFVAFHSCLGRQYYDRDTVDLRAYTGNVLLVIAANTLIVAAVLGSLSGPISRLTSFPASWLWAVVVYSLGNALFRVVLILWQVRVKPLAYGSFQIAQSFMVILFTIVLVVTMERGWRGSVEADAYSMASFGAIAIAFLVATRAVRPSFDLAHIRAIWIFNGPLIFHAIGRTIVTMSDRVFITNMVGVADTGLYAAGYQLGMVVFVLTSCFGNAWVPHLFARLKENRESDKRRIVKFTYVYFVGVIAFSLIWGAIAPWFVSFFLGGDFAGSAPFVIWIALGFAFNSVYWMTSAYIMYAKKTYIVAAVTLFAAGLNVLLNYLLVSRYGAIGAAQATTITFLVIGVLTWVISTKVYPMPWALRVAT